MAIWVDSGRLIYADRRLLDAPVGEIKSVGLRYRKVYTRARLGPASFTYLDIGLADGRNVEFRSGLFVESADELVAKLSETLGLTMKPSEK